MPQNNTNLQVGPQRMQPFEFELSGHVGCAVAAPIFIALRIGKFQDGVRWSRVH